LKVERNRLFNLTNRDKHMPVTSVFISQLFCGWVLELNNFCFL
jgi:hypothetical protein